MCGSFSGYDALETVGVEGDDGTEPIDAIFLDKEDLFSSSVDIFTSSSSSVWEEDDTT